MKVLALISGGKDSIFNIYKCQQQGHQIVALGNLYNQKSDGTELDSYMYQTVGTQIVQSIAEALELPLFRHPITRTTVVKTLQYKEDEKDEVEDLFQLLKDVLVNYPQIKAVSTGAIHSTYQKLRVQNICQRLGLTSLAYLWQYDQSQLLKQMINYPLEAIIIKVASYGLKAEHLGKTITELQGYFEKLKLECGMNVCGQGGEYQSLVLDCPMYRKRIVIQQSEVIYLQKNEIAPVAYLQINKVSLVAKH